MFKFVLAAFLLFSGVTVAGEGLTPAPGLPLSGSGPVVNKVINVTAPGYGAKCDGSSDDYPAFAAASTAAAATPGSTIYIPPSTTSCLLSAAIAVPTQTTIWAYPGTVTVAPKVGNVAVVLLFGLNSFATNVTIYGLTLDGGGVDFANAAPLVQAYRVERFLMDRVIIQNTRGLGLNLSSSNRSGVQNSTIINVGNHWITTTSAADRAQGLSFCCNDAGNGLDNFATNNYFEKIGLDAINVGLQTRFLATNNRFNLTSNQTSVVSASAYPAAIYCSSSDVTATGNSVSGAIGNSFDTAFCSLNISGNRITTSGAAGILVSAATSAVISGNTILDNNQVSTGANANFPGGIAFCGLGANITIVGNRSGNLAGATQKNGIYGSSATVGTCTSPTFTNLVISPSNDLSTNATAPIGGGATGLYEALVVGFPTGGALGDGTINAKGIYVSGVSVASPLTGTSASIGGAALLAGACATATTVTVTGATTTMVPKVSPQTYPGDGIFWDAYVSSVNTVTIKVCASVAATPTASLYNVRVIQ